MSTARVELRLSIEVLRRVDAWRREQDPSLNRAAAIEELVRLGLMASENSALAKSGR